jgi:superfamily II DNA or RNA helicase
MLRGDLARCLIVAPGSLVEQWQDELSEKFGLSFEILSREATRLSITGNPFEGRNLVIARLDVLSRSDELQDQLAKTDWDLVVVDEAHRMSAHYFGGELKTTRRYELGRRLGQVARHLLLMTATPHSGKEEDSPGRPPGQSGWRRRAAAATPAGAPDPPCHPPSTGQRPSN